MTRMSRTLLLLCAALGLLPQVAPAQEHIPSRVEIAWNRYYTVEEIGDMMARLAAAYPEIVSVAQIGESSQGRPLWVATVNNPATGPETSKPGIWIDGNIHGNEVQASEVVLYTLWYLSKAHGRNARLTEIMDRTVFYLAPSINPDGRAAWLTGPSTPHSSRHNQIPVDDDRDGLIDEDGPDDLDGDGHITGMWRPDPTGRWVRSQTDQRVFVRLRDDQEPAPGIERWTWAGEEGIDNDGDGRINEDGPSGFDMNRNFPGDWQPDHVQRNAGPYPLWAPEARAAFDFIQARPNIGAAQAYHNTGGMILRGPGAAYRESEYARDDVSVYDELARTGEQMLPYYRSMVTHRDLYRVHGGFLGWAYEVRGAFAFTNEMWTPSKYFQRDVSSPAEDQQWLWRDRMAFGQLFTEYTWYDHPTYGRVLVGGLNKWSSRNTPTFMLEEECHRNFAFTVYHAEQLPLVSFIRTETARVPGTERMWSITTEIRNSNLIPTRSAVHRRRNVGRVDLLTCEAPAGTVVAAARLGSWFDFSPVGIEHEPARVRIPQGIPGRGSRIFRFFVEAEEGATVRLKFESERAPDSETTVELRVGGGVEPPRSR